MESQRDKDREAMTLTKKPEKTYEQLWEHTPKTKDQTMNSLWQLMGNHGVPTKHNGKPINNYNRETKERQRNT